MRVCIVGAGASGIVMVKELLESGHEPVCFEATDAIGGVYTYTYDGTLMTSSSHLTAFSDFPPKCSPTIWTAEQFVEYLEEYAKAFDVTRHVRLQTRVLSIQRTQSGDPFWRVVVQSTRGEEQHFFDHVVVATGTNNVPKRYKYEGQDTYLGAVLHSGDISTWERFDNKSTVCVGMGESGADVCLSIARRPGASVTVSIRSNPGWIVPRFRGSMPSDMMTNRLLWGLPRRVGGLMGWVLARMDAAQADPVIRATGEMNRRNQTTDLGPFGTFGTKSTAGVEAIVKHGAVEKPDIKRLGPGQWVTFVDGTQVEAAYVVQSTGFEPTFRMLQHRGKSGDADVLEDDALMAQVRVDLGNVRRGLYKHAIHPELGTRLFFQGFIRPGFGAIPPLTEMQARWFVSLLDGTTATPLPGKKEMREQMRADADGEDFLFRKSAGARVASLVDHVIYFNDIAELVGCLPPWRRLLCDPLALWKVLTGPHSGAQFRLAGPGAKPAVARATLLSYPDVFVPVPKKLAVISAALWGVCGLVWLALLPLPSSWLRELRADLAPVGFANSRALLNNLARLEGAWGDAQEVQMRAAGAVREDAGFDGEGRSLSFTNKRKPAVVIAA